MYLERVKARLEELSIVRLDKIIPCTEEEIYALEQEVGLLLPAAYREFLLWMGHGSGGLLGGSDFLYEDLILLQRDAAELMKEDTYPEPLPEDAFVVTAQVCSPQELMRKPGWNALLLRVSPH